MATTSPSTPIPYTPTAGGSASVPGITEVQVAPGTFDATATATPAVIDVSSSSLPLIYTLLPLMNSRFDVVATASMFVSISTTQQPKQPMQVRVRLCMSYITS